MRNDMLQRVTSALVFLVLLSGCKSDGPRLVPVCGKLVYRNQPIKGAMVMFLADDAKGTRAPAAFAQTDASGSFSLQSPPHGTGAVPGYYRILVISGEDTKRGIPTRYSLSHKTPLTMEVPDGGDNNVTITVKD